jgi:hypothetical protein
MDAEINSTVTKLVVTALDAAGVTDRTWQSHFKIRRSRLDRIRSGQASLTDPELNRISRVTGEPWQDMVVGVLGSQDELTADTRELLGGLHAVSQAARFEAKKPRPFRGVRQLIQKKSA